MNEALKYALTNLRKQTLKPAPRLTLTEWADEFRFLPPEASSSPGKWRTGLVEVLRGPMDAITDPSVHKVSLMFASQVGKSEILLNTLGFYIHQNPSPILLAQPTQNMAESFATDRISPMVRDTPVLRELVSDPARRDSGSTKTHLVFPGGTLDVVSAGSPSELASRPKKIILLDEIDRMSTLSGEGNPLKLAEQRSMTFFDSKVVLVSTPTNHGSSRIEDSFLQGDQRYFNVPCPHCDFFQKLEWSQVKWDQDDASTAHYECSACQKPWTESQRLTQVKRGKYIATAPFSGHASFTCNALSSPWVSIPELAEEFLASRSNIDELRTFVNLKLAETWKPKVDVPDYQRLMERQESYPPGTVPSKEIMFLTMGVDVQGDRLECQTVGWGRDKQSWVIDYNVIVAPTHTDEPWNKLFDIIQNKSYPVAESTRTMPITFTAIDSGYNSQRVYDFVSRFSPTKVRAIKGSDSLLTAYKMGSDLTTAWNGQRSRFGHKLWMVGSSHIKTEVYSNLRLSGSEGNFPSGFVHIPQLGEEFYKGLTSEALQKTKKGHEWVKVRPRNEQLDTFVYARAAAAMFGLDRFSPREWAKLQGEDVPQVVPAGVQQETKIKAPSPQYNKKPQIQHWSQRRR